MSIILNNQTFNNGGSATFNNNSLNEIKFGSYTVWKKEIKLLSDTSAWTLVETLGDYRVATLSGGVLTCSAHYWSTGGPRAYAWRQLTPCTGVTRISFEYKNDINTFAQAATYVGIVGYARDPYYGTGTNAGGSDRYYSVISADDAYKIGSTRYIMFPTGSDSTSSGGGTAHNSWTSYTFNFGSTVNISNYYFIVSCSVQGSTSGSVSIRNLVST